MVSQQIGSPQDTKQAAAVNLSGPTAAYWRHRSDPECRDEGQFSVMRKAFHSTGGLLTLNEVARRFRALGGPDTDKLGEAIAARSVVAFDWCSNCWLPMFQFSRQRFSVHASLQPVLRELCDVYDGWETASWFALPNTWLRQRTPVDMLVHDLPAVWYAAKVDRFIALGDAIWEKQASDTGPVNPITRQGASAKS